MQDLLNARCVECKFYWEVLNTRVWKERESTRTVVSLLFSTCDVGKIIEGMSGCFTSRQSVATTIVLPLEDVWI